MTSLLYLLLGTTAGVLSGILGIGGGVIIVPALLLLFRMPPQTAVGTSLAALLAPVGLLGVMAYYRAGHLNPVAALWIAVGLFGGIFVGAQVAQRLNAVLLTRLFALLLVVVAWRLWVSAGRAAADAPPHDVAAVRGLP